MSLLLHIIPSHVFMNRYQGSYKDVIGRVRILENHPSGYRKLIVTWDDPSELALLQEDMKPSHILVEYSSLGRTVAALRMKYPEAFIAVRTHNIEPLQQWDNNGWLPIRALPRLFYGCLRLLKTDWLSARYSDKLYSISQWETDHYWRWMKGRKNVHWVPYFTPDYLLLRPTEMKEDIIACLPSSLEHRKTQDLVSRFARFAEAAKPLAKPTVFAVSGDLSRWKMKMPSSIELTGLIENLPSYMARVKAVALLSPLGYGFKTTIADAIAFGCYVIVHPSIYKRCPDILKPACVELRSLNAEDIFHVLKLIEAPFPLDHTMEKLKEITLRRLETDFCFPGEAMATS